MQTKFVLCALVAALAVQVRVPRACVPMFQTLCGLSPAPAWGC